jgi:hypothetical protein
MDEHAIVMAVGSYRSSASAARGLRTICGGNGPGREARVAAAVLEKGADGQLTMERHQPGTDLTRWDDLLLGAALIVLAAPLGILFLVPVMPSTASWAGVASIVGHLWHGVPKDQLRRMSALLEMGQAALVVVALDHEGSDLEAGLADSTDAVVADAVVADLHADCALAIDDAVAWLSLGSRSPTGTA